MIDDEERGASRGIGAGDHDADDLISHLDDAILGAIMSLLPIREAGRMQAISRRWRQLWRSMPLDFVADGSFSERDVSELLSGRLGPARRFSLPCIRSTRHRYDYDEHKYEIDDNLCDTISVWLRSPALAGLHELELAYGVAAAGSSQTFPNLLPLSGVQHVAPALRVAKFGNCHLPPNYSMNASFARLKQLTLHGCTFSEDTFRCMLSGCHVLESLLLRGNVGFGCLNISSPTLRSITFCFPWNSQSEDGYFQELAIEDAPCLERLLIFRSKDYGPTAIRVIRAPRLEILGFLARNVLKLHLGTTVFQGLNAVRLTTTMRSVKVLVLDSVGPNLDAVLDFLKCFPCLETLYVILGPRSNIKNVRKYDSPDDRTKCLEHHLKKVVMKVYQGKGVEVDFSRFFVLNAKVLEIMEFGVTVNCHAEWKANQNRLLRVEDRASRDARFEFKRFYWSILRDFNRLAHDLSISDPFETSFLDGYFTV